jgi:hypothetical protein
LLPLQREQHARSRESKEGGSRKRFCSRDGSGSVYGGGCSRAAGSIAR